MRYFDYIDNKNLNRIFYKKPCNFDNNSDIEILKYALGAFLYVPATQYNMIYKSIIGEVRGVRPLAICLEDAVGLNGEKEAISNLKEILSTLNRENLSDIPLIFIRIKDIKQLKKIEKIIYENRKVITGILIPKANTTLIEECVRILDNLGLDDIYIIPIIESKEFIYIESKDKYFKELYTTVLKYKKRILNIRIGVTDILGLYGIRRSKYFSIYDNLITSNFINDIINYLSRPELDIPISGGVSEYFNMNNEEIKDRYIKEILLDKFHGFIGKTVIHPTQIPIVQALCTVNYEDYTDAKSILNSKDSVYGVSKGVCEERMNEVNPHLSWAKKTIILSQTYGVLNEGVDYNELLKF